MATEKQIAANRRNARKSTGPRTAEGKSRSSLNALRHGLRARTIILPAEDPEEYQALLGSFEAHYQPENPPEYSLVEEMANAEWKLRRVEGLERDLYAENMPGSVRILHLERLSQVEERLKRAWHRAHHELERIQAARQKQPEQPKEKAKSDKSFVPPKKLKFSWVNPRTGEEQVHALYENGKPVKEFTPDS